MFFLDGTSTPVLHPAYNVFFLNNNNKFKYYKTSYSKIVQIVQLRILIFKL